jgi:hypothetical protein
MVYDRHLRSALRDERNTSGRRFTIANPREGPLPVCHSGEACRAVKRRSGSGTD